MNSYKKLRVGQLAGHKLMCAYASTHDIAQAEPMPMPKPKTLLTLKSCRCDHSTLCIQISTHTHMRTHIRIRIGIDKATHSLNKLMVRSMRSKQLINKLLFFLYSVWFLLPFCWRCKLIGYFSTGRPRRHLHCGNWKRGPRSTRVVPRLVLQVLLAAPIR